MPLQERLCTHIADTTFLKGFGKIYRRTFPEAKGALVARQEITGCLLTRYSGYYELVRLGVTCLLTLETGKIPIAGFAVGVTEAYGKNSLKYSWSSLIMNG